MWAEYKMLCMHPVSRKEDMMHGGGATTRAVQGLHDGATSYSPATPSRKTSASWSLAKRTPQLTSAPMDFRPLGASTRRVSMPCEASHRAAPVLSPRSRCRAAFVLLSQSCLAIRALSCQQECRPSLISLLADACTGRGKFGHS